MADYGAFSDLAPQGTQVDAQPSFGAFSDLAPAAAASASAPVDVGDGRSATLQQPHLDQSYMAGLARTALGQGTAFGLGDEIAAGARSLVGGENYDAALSDERAKVKQFEDENPVASTVGELGGSLLTPGLGMLGEAKTATTVAGKALNTVREFTGLTKPAETTLGRITQGTKVGAGLGAVYGFNTTDGGDGTLADQIENRATGALHGAEGGALTGGVVPLATELGAGVIQRARNAATPTIARMTGGTQDAADEIMASRLRSAGESPSAMRDQIDAANHAATFYGGGASASKAVSPLALADLSPTMQKMAGSAARSSDDAMTRADAFLNSRQTGNIPRSEAAQNALVDAGITTRNPLAPIDKDAGPAGQYERVKDALTRSMTLQDKDFHQFGPNAYRTEQAMMAALKDKSNILYGDARNAAQNLNIAPVISPIIQKIANDADASPIGQASLIKKALRQFTTGNGNVVTSLDGFDKAKQVVDGLIGRARTAGDKTAVAVLTDVKNKLISAVDAIPDQGVGQKYQAARNYFSSQMEMKDAIDLGRQAFKENSDVVSDQFHNLTEGQKKLFRLGLIESFEANMGRSKRTNDITQAFETPRVQDLLRQVIPRPTTATGRVKEGAVFADRPERFGDFIANEKQMVKTGQKVLGNSATQERAMDDAKFTRHGLGQMIEGLKGHGLTGIALEAMSAGMNKVFGMREDVATEVARRVFTADPQARDAILQRLEKAYGRQRMPALLQMMGKVGLLAGADLSTQAGRGSSHSPGISGGIGPRYDDNANLRSGQ